MQVSTFRSLDALTFYSIDLTHIVCLLIPPAAVVATNTSSAVSDLCIYFVSMLRLRPINSILVLLVAG